MKEQIIKKPNIYDYPSTDERTYIELDGKVNWEKYAKALDEFIVVLAECKCYHSEDKLDKMAENPASGQAWICPRCGKVHSWLSMTCDCPPNVIAASTIESKEVTEIKGEECSCSSCKHYKVCFADRRFSFHDCQHYDQWEPIKTE